MRYAWLAAVALAWSTAIAAAVHPEHEWLELTQAPVERVDVESAGAEPASAVAPAEAGHHHLELLFHVDLRIGKDGVLRERRVHARRFLTVEGVRQAGTLSFGARSQVDHVTLEAAYAQHPDGSTKDLGLADVHVYSDSEPDLFSDAYVVSAPFSGLAPGSTAVLVYERRRDARAWPLPWSFMIRPPAFVPTRLFRVDVAWDEGAPAPMIEHDVPGLRCETTGERSTRCELRDVEALPYDPDVLSWPDLTPHLMVSERHTWSELARKELALVEQGLTGGDSLAPLVDRLVGDVSDSEARLRVLHRFVADEVRYVGRFQGVSAVVPHASAETLERRYGDCKDKVVLFLDLARRAGLDAHAVLVGTDRYRLGRLIQPSWLYFDHMIACVDGLDGGERCVDLTSPYAGTGELPAANHGAVALDLREGAAAPRTVPRPEFTWQIAVEGMNRLDCDGSIDETLERRFAGALAIALRSDLGELVTEERLRWAEESYRDVMGDKQSTEVALDGVDSADGPLVVRSTTRFPSLGSRMDTMTQYTEADAWLTHYAEGYLPENRHHPYDFMGLELTTRLQYELCSGFIPDALGAKLDFYFDFGSLTRVYRKEGSRVVVETRLELPNQTVEAADLDRFRRSVRAAVGQSRVWFGIRRAAGTPKS